MRAPFRLADFLRLGVIFVLIAASACAAPSEAELFEVSEVGPARVEPGRVLFVRGMGFPAGRSAQLRVRGTMHAPGREPAEVDIELEGRAVSAERVEALFSQDTLTALGGRGSVHGRVSVRFRTAAQDGWVVGTSEPLVLDVAGSGALALRDEVVQTRRANAWLQQAGLELAERAPDETGLPVFHVRGESPAARAGLIPEDRIVALDGVTAYSLVDLVPAPGRNEVAVQARRRGEAAPFVVHLPLAVDDSRMSQETKWAIQLGLGWLLFLLLWLAPSAGVADALGRRLQQRRERVTVKGWLPRIAVALATLVALPTLDHFGLLRVPVEGMLLAAFALRTCASWIGRDRGQALRQLMHAALGFAAAGAALLSATALGGTTDMAMLVHQQGALPTEWTLLATPVGPLVLTSVLLGACLVPASLRGEARGVGRVARTLDDGVLLVLAALAAALLLGGWGTSEASGPVRALGAAVYTALGLGLFVWMRRARTQVRPTLASGVATLLVTAAVACLTTARVAFVPPADLEPALSAVTSIAAMLFFATVLARVFSRRVQRGPTLAHPYL
ncbi:MAG: hypothetical protein AB8I08_32340 [Sandaracinaceae bacterium]